jgi:glycosyltransferase involved in cell wall biosynthesis
MSTSLGEGWGLSTTEAMACGTPVVMPRHTANIEIIGDKEERGLLVDCTDRIVLPAFDHNRIRPLVNIEDMAKAIANVYLHPDKAYGRAKAASDWIVEHCDWDRIAERFDSIFRSARPRE